MMLGAPKPVIPNADTALSSSSESLANFADVEKVSAPATPPWRPARVSGTHRVIARMRQIPRVREHDKLSLDDEGEAPQGEGEVKTDHVAAAPSTEMNATAFGSFLDEHTRFEVRRAPERASSSVARAA